MFKSITSLLALRTAMAAFYIFLSAACALAQPANQPVPASIKLNVVTTTSMIADLARQIGGDQVEVTALMGAGVDPHGYRQTRTDIVALTRADLVLWHGLFLEAQMEELMRALEKSHVVIAVAESLPKQLLRTHDEYKDKFDPHVWMQPQLWSQLIPVVRDALIAARPQSRSLFESNALRHMREVNELVLYAQKALESVPKKQRVLITAHDAFGYFGAAYGIEVMGIQGLSTESEAGLNRIKQLVNVLVERKIRSIFIESSVSDRNIRALIEGAGAQGHTVIIGGELFSDSMGQDKTYEGTYIGMMDHNITLIARALGGEAPAQGMRGLLSVRGLLKNDGSTVKP